MDIVDLVYVNDRPQQCTFRTGYVANIVKAFAPGHPLVFKTNGICHLMKVVTIVRVNEDTIEVTAVYDSTPPPMAEFSDPKPEPIAPPELAPLKHSFTLNDEDGEAESPSDVCGVCRQVRRVAAATCPGPLNR